MLILTPGNTADCVMAQECVSLIPGIKELLADKGYDTDAFRGFLKQQKIRPAGRRDSHGPPAGPGWVYWSAATKDRHGFGNPDSCRLVRGLVLQPGRAFDLFNNQSGRALQGAGLHKLVPRYVSRSLLPGQSAHGLRKATCRRLAEAGCSANEIAAISGHTSLREVERYTKAADQKMDGNSRDGSHVQNQNRNKPWQTSNEG
jgi:hypothetical protein